MAPKKPDSLSFRFIEDEGRHRIVIEYRPGGPFRAEMEDRAVLKMMSMARRAFREIDSIRLKTLVWFLLVWWPRERAQRRMLCQVQEEEIKDIIERRSKTYFKKKSLSLDKRLDISFRKLHQLLLETPHAPTHRDIEEGICKIWGRRFSSRQIRTACEQAKELKKRPQSHSPRPSTPKSS